MTKYNQIMDSIVVTEDMKQRIMSNIANVKSLNRRKQFRTVVSSIAALLILTLMIPLFTSLNKDEPDVAVIPDIAPVESIAKLEDLVGFEIKPLAKLIDSASEITYVSYWKEIAAITYSLSDDTIIYRVSLGADDNSGDFSTYDDVQTIQVNNLSVEIKGYNGLYNLIVWQSEGLSYSISSTKGLDEQAIVELIKSQD